MSKKFLSLLLAALLSVTMLTGCGVNELGYLSLSKEISKLTEFSFENSTQVELSKKLAGESYNIDIKLTGEANLKKLDDMYLSFDMLLKVNDIEIKKPIKFIIADNKLYLPKTALIELIALEKLVDINKSSEKIIKELLNNDLKDVEYILLTELDEYNNKISNEELSELAVNYITKAFKGFDSKLVTKTSKGYSFELNSENILVFLKSLFKYLAENKELVFNETIDYINKVYENLEIKDITDEQKQEIINEIEESRQEFYDFIDEAVEALDSDEFADYVKLIKGSKIKEEIYKSGSAYNQTISSAIVIEGENYLKLSSNTAIKPEAIEKKKVVGNIIKSEELSELYNKAENKINPVKKMEFEWFSEGYEANVNKTRLEGNSSVDFQPYIIVEGRIYLPLRYICESFGEEVEWDNDNRKTYIIRGSEKIDMTGIIVDSKTMIKIRDFERLGYKVGYTQENGLSKATLEK